MSADSELGPGELMRWLNRIEAKLEELGTTLVVKAVYDVQYDSLKKDLDQLRKHLTWLVYTVAGAVIAAAVTFVLKGMGGL